ncbi:hypothetical protein RRG08_059036 [Elysia crispata]|uniref:Uncharacterized protein n=1 Tax=Elysia crispata TaxID=231223 RepID=A0AAE1AGN2_9GAST|nr:hypothetical protein RRG08_059036 [Elysia crispata]
MRKKELRLFTLVCSDHIQVEDFKSLPANETVLIRVYLYIVFLCSGTGLPCVADSSAAAHLMLDTRTVQRKDKREGRERDGRTEITEWIAKVWSDNLWRAEDREKWRELVVTCCDARTVVRPRDT